MVRISVEMVMNHVTGEGVGLHRGDDGRDGVEQDEGRDGV